MVRGGRAYAKAPGQACASVCGSEKTGSQWDSSRAIKQEQSRTGGQCRGGRATQVEPLGPL